jgi:hypothetical protein
MTSAMVMQGLSALGGRRLCGLPTLALGVDGGGVDTKAGRFLDRVEAEMAAPLAEAPEKVAIPRGLVLLRKDWKSARRREATTLHLR